MSKLRNPFFLFAAAFLSIFFIQGNARPQAPDIRIKVENGVISVQVKQLAENDRPERRFYFSKEYAGHDISGDRISKLALTDASGRAVSYQKLAPGEFLAAGSFSSINYDIAPGIPKSAAASGHMSWLVQDRGLLMLDDILPKFEGHTGKTRARIEFDLPPGWRISGAAPQPAPNIFEITDAETEVFFAGKDQRVKKGLNNAPDLVISGEWLFTDDEAAKMAEEIYAVQQKLFGGAPFGRSQIILTKFPNPVRPGTWEAETRGNSVVIVSADMPFRTQSVQKLHEQMRHEIFHLWVPNAVNLSGNYDWFYEGFALYQSLRLAIGANRIRFDDMLDTLSRAYNIDNMQSRRSSLIEASGNRWAGAETQIYARGMLVAFLCDITMLQNTKGKRSVEDILRRVHTEHSMLKPREDGNAAVLRVLESYDYLRPLAAGYIRGSENIAWKNELDAIGLEAEQANTIVKLKVKDKLNGRQKVFLDKLGYNNWRKLSRGTK